jgi:histidinol-phosphate aminotransferase
MAGARVGVALAEPGLIAAFDRVRDHFALGRVAQAGARAALAAPHWLAHVRARVAEGRARLGRIAAANGLAALPSTTNFVAIDCGGEGDFARAVLREALARGLFLRMPGVAPLDRCLRISVGDEAALDVVEEVLPQALKAARGA